MSRPQASAAAVSLAGAVLVLGLKTAASVATGSVSLLSDAAESVVNVLVAVVLLLAVRLASRPADYEHPYGHQKAELLSAAFEALLIFAAGAIIIVAAVQRLLSPRELDNVQVGLTVAVVAGLINLGLALWLRSRARKLQSAALDANARHLFTDVWSSGGVIAAVLLTALLGWLWLDAAVAIVVGLNILREGWLIMAQAVSQLLDERLPDDEEALILQELDATNDIVGYHRLRSRRSGNARFVEVDVFMQPATTVEHAHVVVRDLEDRLAARLPNLVSTVHVEPHAPGIREGSTSPREEY